MSKVFNLARMSTATTGTGIITLGSAVSGFLTFAQAGVADGDIVSYGIKDGTSSEHGYGTYTSSGTTLSRTVVNSTNSNAAISLSGSAEVFITPLARDLLTESMRPGGRLTLATATPVMTSDQLAKTTIFYTPYKGAYVPLYDGSTFVPTEFTELSQTTTDATKSPAAVVANAVYDLFVWNDAGTLRCTRGPNWTKAATITVTIATPAVVTWTGGNLNEGDPIIFSTTGALPTGITAGTVYFVSRNPASANAFNISTSLTNAMTGTLVNTSGSQSGVHTGTNRTRTRGTGAGTTELTLTKGIWLNTNAITNGPAALRGTYVGSVRTNGSSQVDWAVAQNSTPTSRKLNVWNCYNRVLVGTNVTDDTASYTYTTALVRASHNSVAMRVEVLFGLIEDAIEAQAVSEVQTVNVIGAQIVIFSFVDSTSLGTVSDAGLIGISADNVSAPTADDFFGTARAPLTGYLSIGSHFVAALEFGDGANANTLNNNSGNMLFVWAWM